MLLDRFPIDQFPVPFLIVTKNNPTLRSNDAQPLVVIGVVLEFVFDMPLDGKERFGLPDGLRKAMTEVSVKVEGQ